jgi:prepilin-type N-terminal cleavage/methylation domain-containing protein
MMPPLRLSPRRGFSLVEVVIAVGIFAVVIVGVLAVLTPTIKSVGAVADESSAQRVIENLESAIARVPFETLEDYAQLPGSTASPLVFVASRDGSRILLLSHANLGENNPSAPANRALNLEEPGLAQRDRFFRIVVSKLGSPGVNPNLRHTPDNGFLALQLRLEWPYRLATGPRTTTTMAYGASADGSTETDSVERRSILVNLAITR